MKRSEESAVLANFLGEKLKSDKERAAFERDVAKLVATAELLNVLEGVRKKEGLSKAELARRIGTKPSVVSRLLSGRSQNPTLGTVADVADALGVYLDVRIKTQPRDRKRCPPIEVRAPVA